MRKGGNGERSAQRAYTGKRMTDRSAQENSWRLSAQKRRVKVGFAELRRELDQLPGDAKDEYKRDALKWLTESEYQAIACIDNRLAMDRLRSEPRPAPIGR